MRLSRSLVAIAIMLLPLTLYAGGSQVDTDLTTKIEKIILEVQQLKVGMSRADVLKIFATEGGLASMGARTYVYRSCPYIKIDVEFETAEGAKYLTRESATDRITMISRPYLAQMVLD